MNATSTIPPSMKRLRILALALMILSPLGVAAQNGEEPAPEGVPYTAEISGDLSNRLRSLIDESSALLTQQDRLPGSEAALRRRLADDLDRIARILRSEGYYNHNIEYEVDDEEHPVQIHITVERGPAFHLADYEIVYTDEVPASAPRDATAVGLTLGERARAAELRAAEERIAQWLQESGYPFGRVASTRYLADMDEAEIRAEVRVVPGEATRFGPLSIVGLETVREDYLRRIIDWHEGSLYDQRLTEEARQKLSKTGLFESVVTNMPDSSEDGELPVEVQVAERPHRTIGAGVSFATDDGPGLEVFWEHRNLFGAAEQLSLRAQGTQEQQSVTADFRKPNYLRLDQSLLFENELRHEDSDAFEEYTSSHFLGLERKLNERWTVRAGPSLLVTRVTEDEDTSYFGLLGFTGGVTYDGSDDLLNPTSGARLDATLTPYVSVVGESAKFIRGDATGSLYYSPLESDRVVLAARGRFGSLAGSSRGDIPANLRFYAGGGGSVRGYAFRSVGPLDDDDDPIGGRSVVELGLEARIKVTDTIGIVPFLDAGQVYETPWPQGENLQYAAGLGLRYYTAFGPLRVDVATPLNRRKGIDRIYQFYISIGQAF